jgi:hypothetical protein
LAGDEEPDAPGVPFGREAQARSRLLMRADNDVLEDFAQAGLDGALEAAVRLEIVRHRTELPDVAARLREYEPRAVAVLGTGGIELLERAQAAGQSGGLLLRLAEVADARIA